MFKSLLDVLFFGEAKTNAKIIHRNKTIAAKSL